MPPKRPYQVIDLTGDDDRSPPNKIPIGSGPSYGRGRPVPQSAGSLSSQSYGRGSTVGGSSFTSSDPYGVYADDEDDNTEDLVLDSSQDYSTSSYILYGTLQAKIVGCRYYTGVTTVGEMALLRREPNNQYDRNAIAVQNMKGDQIGHIPRETAAVIAKYIDDRSLQVEGRIQGKKGVYQCPISLEFYGPNDPERSADITARMRRDRLPVGNFEEFHRAKKALDRALAREEAKRQGAQGGSSQYVGGRYQEAGENPTMESLVEQSEKYSARGIDEVVATFGVGDEVLQNMPMAKQPEEIATKMLPYQLQGLQWLLDKESPTLPQKTDEAVQLWKKHPTQRNMYLNIATSFAASEPQLMSGGILADDMGLGKTIQIISLIMADPQRLNSPIKNAGPTLILSPLSVMSNWSGQIKQHVKESSALRVLTFHGANRKVALDRTTIANYDVVITTYETVMAEYWSSNAKVPRPKGLFSINWRRIVLDEGHNIRNPQAKRAVAVCALRAESRWVCTGTPVINSLKDLYSIAKFLRLSGGLDQFEAFNSRIIRPVNAGNAVGYRLLQSLMRGICLRRNKEMKFVDLRIPELSEYVHKITLAEHEQSKYDVLDAEARGALKEYQARTGQDAANAYRHVLEILLRLRQVCNHWRLCGDTRIKDILNKLEKEKTVELTPENCEALRKMLQLSIESQEDCPICLDTLRDPVITACSHVYCYSCIERVIDTQHKCPLCRADLESTQHVVRPGKEEDLEGPSPATFDENESSSKIEALLSILDATRARPGEPVKSVIFSQWTSFLNLLEPPLRARGYKFCRIDGTMNSAQRDAAMTQLADDPDCTVLLASLAVCSVGLNLVAASQVVLADSWWAPAIEDQAVDRVHRLGQTKPTTVWRLVAEGTIEERVLQIQADKRELMALAVAEKGKKKGGRTARLQDVQRLLGTQAS